MAPEWASIEVTQWFIILLVYSLVCRAVGAGAGAGMGVGVGMDSDSSNRRRVVGRSGVSIAPTACSSSS